MRVLLANLFQRSSLFVATLLLVTLASGGCSTVRTLNEVPNGGAMVMSGTRLNVSAMNDRPAALKEFGTMPPTYPVVDFPFSLSLDVVLLSITAPTAALLWLFS